jgi:hypothetical protein
VLNLLRSNLELALPGAIGLFSKPDSKITLAFLRRFPTAERVEWLWVKRLQSWLVSMGYSGGASAAVLFGRLSDAAPGLVGTEGQARGRITLGLVTMIETLNAEVEAIEQQMSVLLNAHPDQHIFTSLPRSGMLRAASLLAEIGDCRERFPTDEALAALAGASPSTRHSGKREQTVFRWACNKKLRAAVMDFANGSRIPTRGRPPAIDGQSNVDAAIPTRSASSPALGSGSSGVAGKTARRSTRRSTDDATLSLLDIGHFYVVKRFGEHRGAGRARGRCCA